MRSRALPFAVLVLAFLALIYVAGITEQRNAVANSRHGCQGNIRDRVAIINEQWQSAQASLIIGKGETATQIAARAKVRGFSITLVETLAHRVDPADAPLIPPPLRRYATFSCAGEFKEPSLWP